MNGRMKNLNFRVTAWDGSTTNDAVGISIKGCSDAFYFIQVGDGGDLWLGWNDGGNQQILSTASVGTLTLGVYYTLSA